MVTAKKAGKASKRPAISKAHRAGRARKAGGSGGSAPAGRSAKEKTHAAAPAAMSEARRNLSLRRALDAAKEALARHRWPEAGKAIAKAGSLGPLAVRPTRLLMELVARYTPRAEGLDLAALDRHTSTPESQEHIHKGNALRERGRLGQAIEQYRKALGYSPLSPEAAYRLGLTFLEMGERLDAALWLDLVPDIVGMRHRRSKELAQFVAEAYLARARIELARGHRAKAGGLALKAIGIKPDYAPARTFIWDLEHE